MLFGQDFKLGITYAIACISHGYLRSVILSLDLYGIERSSNKNDAQPSTKWCVLPGGQIGRFTSADVPAASQRCAVARALF